jgi:tetratricopeptide (TPR) repeat protein
MGLQIGAVAPEPAVHGAQPIDVAWRGIELCRQGDWNEGMYWLSMAAGVSSNSRQQLPGVYFAYFGYGLARYRGKRKEGLQMCKRAVELEFYQPDNYLFLARAYFLVGDRRSAFDVVERGLEIDAGNEELLSLHREIGLRRAPVLRFLARGNPLNRALGRVRHRVLGNRPLAGG